MASLIQCPNTGSVMSFVHNLNEYCLNLYFSSAFVSSVFSSVFSSDFSSFTSSAGLLSSSFFSSFVSSIFSGFSSSPYKIINLTDVVCNCIQGNFLSPFYFRPICPLGLGQIQSWANRTVSENL